MLTVWIAIQSNWQLIDAIDMAGWAVVPFTLSDLAFSFSSEDNLALQKRPKHRFRLGEADVVVVEVMDSTLPDVFQTICGPYTAPVLAVVGNWTLAWRAIELGAQDAIVAPVEPVELLFRIRRLGRSTNLVHVGELSIDLAARRVKCLRHKINLSPVEFRLLACLAEHVGKVVEYDRILDEVWECDSRSGGTLHQVKNCVRRLRQKIEVIPSRPQYIVSVRQVGYRLRSQAQWEEAAESQPLTD